MRECGRFFLETCVAEEAEKSTFNFSTGHDSPGLDPMDFAAVPNDSCSGRSPAPRELLGHESGAVADAIRGLRRQGAPTRGRCW
jgi:hypothetical protein